MTNTNNTDTNKNLKTKSNVFTEEREFIAMRLATGDKFRKIATLRSENGPITLEQVMKFGEEANKEAEEWWRNHPGEPVTIRVLEDEDGKQKQVIEAFAKSDVFFPNDFRTRIYDQNGKQIVGEENIRKEVERREALWEQWKKEGKLEKVNHEVHHTDDGSTVSAFTLLPPADAEKLHPNEINDDTIWIPLGIGDKKIESGKESQRVDENKASEGSSKGESKISEISSEEENVNENIQKENKTGERSNKEESVQKENVEETSIVGKIKKNVNEWSVKKLDFTLSSGGKGKKDCLVHSSAKINISELGDLIYPVEIFTDSERKELSEVLNDSFLINFISSGKVEKESLNKNDYRSISLDNNTQPTDKGKNTLIIFGVTLVLLVAGLAIAKSRFSKNKKRISKNQ